MTYETLLGTYAFALGYEADTLANKCADTVLHNLESVLIGVTVSFQWKNPDFPLKNEDCIGKQDGSAITPDYEEYLFDIFEALEAHMANEDMIEEDVDDDGEDVAHAEQIADLQRKIEQAYVFDTVCFVYTCRRLIDPSLIAGTRTTSCCPRWCRAGTMTSIRCRSLRCSRASMRCTRS